MMKIAISSRTGVVGYALVDDADVSWLGEYTWSLSGAGYARTCVDGKTVLMHRLLLSAKKGEEVDHINRDKLDNRRCNLRLVSRAENCRNTGKPRQGASQFKGVGASSYARPWKAVITVEGRSHYIGAFHTEEEAARAYDSAALHFFKEHAFLNFPDDTPQPYIQQFKRRQK